MAASAGWYILREEQEYQVMHDTFSSARRCDWLREQRREKLRDRQETFPECLPSPHGKKSKLRVPRLSFKSKIPLHLLQSLSKQLVKSSQVCSLMSSGNYIKRAEVASGRVSLINSYSPGRLQPTESWASGWKKTLTIRQLPIWGSHQANVSYHSFPTSLLIHFVLWQRT